MEGPETEFPQPVTGGSTAVASVEPVALDSPPTDQRFDNLRQPASAPDEKAFVPEHRDQHMLTVPPPALPTPCTDNAEIKDPTGSTTLREMPNKADINPVEGPKSEPPPSVAGGISPIAPVQAVPLGLPSTDQRFEDSVEPASTSEEAAVLPEHQDQHLLTVPPRPLPTPCTGNAEIKDTTGLTTLREISNVADGKTGPARTEPPLAPNANLSAKIQNPLSMPLFEEASQTPLKRRHSFAGEIIDNAPTQPQKITVQSTGNQSFTKEFIATPIEEAVTDRNSSAVPSKQVSAPPTGLKVRSLKDKTVTVQTSPSISVGYQKLPAVPKVKRGEERTEDQLNSGDTGETDPVVEKVVPTKADINPVEGPKLEPPPSVAGGYSPIAPVQAVPLGLPSTDQRFDDSVEPASTSEEEAVLPEHQDQHLLTVPPPPLPTPCTGNAEIEDPAGSTTLREIPSEAEGQTGPVRTEPPLAPNNFPADMTAPTVSDANVSPQIQQPISLPLFDQASQCPLTRRHSFSASTVNDAPAQPTKITSQSVGNQSFPKKFEVTTIKVADTHGNPSAVPSNTVFTPSAELKSRSYRNLKGSEERTEDQLNSEDDTREADHVLDKVIDRKTDKDNAENSKADSSPPAVAASTPVAPVALDSLSTDQRFDNLRQPAATSLVLASNDIPADKAMPSVSSTNLSAKIQNPLSMPLFEEASQTPLKRRHSFAGQIINYAPTQPQRTTERASVNESSPKESTATPIKVADTPGNQSNPILTRSAGLKSRSLTDKKVTVQTSPPISVDYQMLSSDPNIKRGEERTEDQFNSGDTGKAEPAVVEKDKVEMSADEVTLTPLPTNPAVSAKVNNPLQSLNSTALTQSENGPLKKVVLESVNAVRAKDGKNMFEVSSNTSTNLVAMATSEAEKLTSANPEIVTENSAAFLINICNNPILLGELLRTKLLSEVVRESFKKLFQAAYDNVAIYVRFQVNCYKVAIFIGPPKLTSQDGRYAISYRKRRLGDNADKWVISRNI